LGSYWGRVATFHFFTESGKWRHDPNDPAHGKLARAIHLVIEASLDPEGADAHLEEAIRLSDALAGDEVSRSLEATWLVRGWIFGISVFVAFQTPALERIADFEKAIADLERVLSKNPKDWQTWYHLGTAFERAKRLEKALEAFEKVRSILGGLTSPDAEKGIARVKAALAARKN